MLRFGPVDGQGAFKALFGIHHSWAYMYVRLDVYIAYDTISADWGRATRLIRAAGWVWLTHAGPSQAVRVMALRGGWGLSIRIAPARASPAGCWIGVKKRVLTKAGSSEGRGGRDRGAVLENNKGSMRSKGSPLTGWKWKHPNERHRYVWLLICCQICRHV